jgi:hypothetical protein
MLLDLLKKSFRSITYFEPSGETVRQLRRYASINDYNDVTVYNGTVSSVNFLKLPFGSFDYVIAREPDEGMTPSEYTHLLELSTAGLFVELNESTDGRKMINIINSSCINS